MSTHCSSCDKSFSSHYNLKRHNKDKHPDLEEELLEVRRKMGRFNDNTDEEMVDSEGESESGSSSDSCSSSGSEDSSDEKDIFNACDLKVVKLIEYLGAFNDSPYERFKLLLVFYHNLKRANIYKALKQTAKNISEDEKFMDEQEAYECAIQSRHFLISKLFQKVENVDDESNEKND